MTRIAISGGPRTGKTTMAINLFGGLASAADRAGISSHVFHTDDLISLGWSEASEAASKWFDEPGPWIVEGVAVSRALRKWREANPHRRPPIDRMIFLHLAKAPTTKGQDTMAKGVVKVHDEIEGWLLDHGIKTEYL